MNTLGIVVLSCLLMGIVVGWLAGLLGIGGGLIIVPVLSFLLMKYFNLSLSIAMPMAVATSLSTIVVTGFLSAKAHFKLGNLDKQILLFCGLGVALGAVAGAQFVSRVSGELLAVIIAVFAFAIALNMLFGRMIVKEQTPNKILLVVVGIATGIMSAAMGIGGGAILVSALCWCGVALRTSIGVSSACGLIIALFGTLSFVLFDSAVNEDVMYAYGYLFIPAVVSISLTSVFVAPLGAKYGQNMNTDKLKRVFAVFLLLVSAKMISGVL